jgi:hypothetical protein
MKALKQTFYLVALMFVIAAGMILRLFGWRPKGETEFQSLFQPGGIAVVSGDEMGADPYPYVYVNEDGSARELQKRERQYLETPFLGPDGGRPYVKWRYRQKNGWGDVSGFLKRSRLPKKIGVSVAPAEDPCRDSKAETIRRLRERGYEVIEGSDGGFRASKPPGTRQSPPTRT